MNNILTLLTSANDSIEAGRYTEALEMLGPSPSQWPSIGSEEEYQAALLELYRAMAYRRSGAGLEAVIPIRRAVQVFNRILARPDVSIDQAPNAILEVYYEAAVIEHQWGDRLEALRWSEEMYRIYSQPSVKDYHLGDPNYPIFLNDMGALAFEMGMPGTARRYLSEALDVFSAKGDTSGVCRALLNLAELEEGLGNRDAALHLIRRFESLDSNPSDNPQFGYLLVRMSLADGNPQQCASIVEHLETGVLHSFRAQGVQAPRSPFWRSKRPAKLGGIEASESCHNIVVTTD